MTTKSTTVQADTPKAKIVPVTAKELENTKVKQGVENAPADKPVSATVTDGDTVVVKGADGNDIEVNAEAQNTTQTLEDAKKFDQENAATRELREQAQRYAGGLSPAVATAAEQARQNDVLPAEPSK